MNFGWLVIRKIYLFTKYWIQHKTFSEPLCLKLSIFKNVLKLRLKLIIMGWGITFVEISKFSSKCHLEITKIHKIYTIIYLIFSPKLWVLNKSRPLLRLCNCTMTPVLKYRDFKNDNFVVSISWFRMHSAADRHNYTSCLI